MTKEYPLRPRENKSCGITEHICECGHNRNKHNTSDMVLTSYPPKYIYVECLECMCPEYNFEKTYKTHIPMPFG